MNGAWGNSILDSLVRRMGTRGRTWEGVSWFWYIKPKLGFLPRNPMLQKRSKAGIGSSTPPSTPSLEVGLPSLLTLVPSPGLCAVCDHR